jgi:hypothetical protein
VSVGERVGLAVAVGVSVGVGVGGTSTTTTSSRVGSQLPVVVLVKSRRVVVVVADSGGRLVAVQPMLVVVLFVVSDWKLCELERPFRSSAAKHVLPALVVMTGKVHDTKLHLTAT